ncbi:MAG: hypothetical protein JEZ00_15050 [Anaerolineaceae bacterium]|nr:hypothetical protein [Anaerolineaceae bacterium]
MKTIATLFALMTMILAACAVRDSRISDFPTRQVVATDKAEPSAMDDPVQTVQATETTDLSETEVPVSDFQPALNTATAEDVVISNLYMVDGENGWAMDEDNRLLVTKDGGHFWADVTPWVGVYQWSGFFALDNQHAWLVPRQETCEGQACSAYQVWRTSDGGENWRTSQPFCMGNNCEEQYTTPTNFAEPVQIQFLDEQRGWLLLNVQHEEMQDKYRIYKTTDGGSDWQFVMDSADAPAAYHVSGLSFLNDNSGWLALSQVGGTEDPGPNWIIYYSIDIGKSWKTFKLPVPRTLPETFNENDYSCGATQLRASPAEILDVIMECTVDIDASQETYQFRFHSITGGKNWSNWQNYSQADFVNATWGWRMQPTEDNTYMVEHSVDAGANWQAISEVPWLGALSFGNELYGWALVKDGKAAGLYQTIDGGATWNQLAPKIGEPAEQQQADSNPRELFLSGANGQTFPVVYYPPSTAQAPVVIFMHQVDMDLSQWDAIAAWLWKDDLSDFRDETLPWLNSSWFPENTLEEKPAILVFTYRDCGEGCSRPENRKILNDTQTILEYVLNQPEIDPKRITVVGTSVGADAALDACFLLQDKTDLDCDNVISVSPGSYLDYEFASVIKVMSKTPTHMYCYAARADSYPATLCMSNRSSDVYEFFVGKGKQHGIELFTPEFEVNLLEILLQAIND